MNTKRLTQMALSVMLVFSIAACNKSESDPASPAAPTSVDQKPENPGQPTEQPPAPKRVIPTVSRMQAEASLSHIGLWFVDVPDLEKGEEGFMTSVWDVKAYRNFLAGRKKLGLGKPDLAHQIQVLEVYVASMEKYVREEVDPKAELFNQDMEAAAAHLSDRNLILSRIQLAKARLAKLEIRLAHKNGTGPQSPMENSGPVAPVEEPQADTQK